jgi:hypothetical protein
MQDRDHTDFSESTEEIKPLTKEEREAKLVEARQRLQEKKALQALKDKEDAKRNEVRSLSLSCLNRFYADYLFTE